MKTDLYRQASYALDSYLNRGYAALNYLKNNEFDKANKVIRLQKAAWHNFRVAYEMLSDAVLLQKINQQVKSKLKEIELMIASLSHAIEGKKQLLVEKKYRLNKERNRLKKYSKHTYLHNQPRFERFV